MLLALRSSGRDSVVGAWPCSGGPVDRRRPADRPGAGRCWGAPQRDAHAACRELGLTAWQDPHNTDAASPEPIAHRSAATALEG